jgi:hypothetical protein
MKVVVVLVLLCVGVGAFWYSGGASRVGLAGPSELPDTITPPNATFVGNEQSNPFAE